MTRPNHIIKRLHGQRGVAAILFALCLPVLLGLAALAVDLARLNLTRAELQNAADAAALGGALSLGDLSVAAPDKPYNWTAATAKAIQVAQSNFANGVKITDVNIDKGSWNLQTRSFALLPPTGVPTGNVPAIRATIEISSTKNNGPLPMFFAPILGIATSNVQARAIAILPAAGGGKGFFPFAISSCILDQLWDSDTNSPKLNPATGQPYIFKIGTPYPSTSCYTGQWTTFQVDNNSAKYVRDILTGDVIPAPISIGEDTWIQPGVKASNYGYVDEDIDVALVVVDDVETHSKQPVVAIVGFHISEVDKHGNDSYVEGHFIDPKIFPSLNPGTGNGVAYGAYTPPILVE
ncbi:MAG: hypothetical protein HGA87_01770 [Desulfobulbaceae bacterium]|nr:hypothetical protein [Desulfobulbaceae bacterium]